MRKILISVAVAAATIATASPALAQRGGGQGYGPAQDIRRDINQLENRIDRAAQRRAISPREAVSLRREARQLQQTFNRFQRNGLDRREIGQLRAGINRLENRIRVERRDDNRRPGNRR